MKTLQKIYIICPAYGKSGGSEALHQLAFFLTKKKMPCFLVYVDFNTLQIKQAPTPLKFKWYKTKQTNVVDDRETNMVIVPETMTGFLKQYSEIKKSIWWLSVNYGKWEKDWLNDNTVHLAQSHYAYTYLVKQGVTELFMLSDFIVSYTLPSLLIKRKIVLYDPRKSNALFDELKVLLKHDYSFIPLTNLDRIRYQFLLAYNRIYLDVGNNPGKDRIPREVVKSGGIVFLLNKGSVQNDIDVPIPAAFKLDNTKSAQELANLIRNTLANPSILSFNLIKENIRNEKRIFDHEIDAIFDTNVKVKITSADKVRLFFYDLIDYFYHTYKGLKNRLSANTQ